MEITQIKQALKTYKTIRKAGFSVIDICKLVNWQQAEAIVEKTGIGWLKILVRILRGVCSLTPQEQASIDVIVDITDKAIA